MGTNTDQNTSPSKEKTEPTTAPASKNAKGAKSKKKAYQIVGGCVAAALLIACIGFASCNAGGSSKAEATATPTATAKAESLFADAKEVTLLDANGKETTDKITVATVKKAEATKAGLKDWYFNHVVKGGYKYGILKYTDDSGKGIYADSTGIYEGNLKEDTATKGYTKPADTSLIYTVDTSKKTLDSAKKSEASATPESTASATTAEAKEEKGDTAADNSSNTSSGSGNSASSTSSNSGKSGSTASQGSKPAGGSSNSSSGSNTSNTSGSSSKSQTCKTVHHDATGHYENTTTQQWVQDSAAWDETVVDQAAWTEPGYQICNGCGYKTTSDADIAEHCGDEGSTYRYVASVYHPAVTHTVHHDATGHYETVVTGQQWVQDSAAYDETVCG